MEKECRFGPRSDAIICLPQQPAVVYAVAVPIPSEFRWCKSKSMKTNNPMVIAASKQNTRARETRIRYNKAEFDSHQ
jgi:hypothetical protein